MALIGAAEPLEDDGGVEDELAHHDSLVTSEIEAVQAAVEHHRDELADYFRRLKGASEPTTIARLAGTTPLAPHLDEIGAAARAPAAASARPGATAHAGAQNQ